MLKFLLGVVAGAVFRDAMIQAYKRNYFPYQDRVNLAYNALRYGHTFESYSDKEHN